ncbi:MAG: hypothetical protein ACYCPM_00710 [Acidobacteriaceae bacterium]|jgi:hypothetical protein
MRCPESRVEWVDALHPHSAQVHLDPFLTGMLIKKAGLWRTIRLRCSLDTKPALLI